MDFSGDKPGGIELEAELSGKPVEQEEEGLERFDAIVPLAEAVKAGGKVSALKQAFIAGVNRFPEDRALWREFAGDIAAAQTTKSAQAPDAPFAEQFS